MTYKEFIKTRWYILIASITLLGFTVYNLLNINRVIELKGAAHLWEVAIERDAIFIQNITYLPLLASVIFAVVQFVPEMVQKRLKLTLHLPVNYVYSVLQMTFYGIATLSVLFAVNFLTLYFGVSHFFTAEIVRHIMLTALEWHLAGLLAYSITAWVVLEPTWKIRVVNIVVSAAALRFFFADTQPEAYNSWLIPMAFGVVILTLLPLNSVTRFKEGKE